MYYKAVQGATRLPRHGKFIPNERLRLYREKRGLSQAQLATLAGCSQPDIQQLETGNRKTTAEWQVRLAPHLGIEPEDLFPTGATSRSLDAGGLDPDIVARAIAFARRLENESDAVASEWISLAYALIVRGVIIDSEPALGAFEVFARRLRRLLRPTP